MRGGQARRITPERARQLAVFSQCLAGPSPPSDAEGLMAVSRALGCLQLDPISVVARSHLLVLHGRLGQYRLADLDHLLWQERRLFEYWAHCASIVLTEDYPLYRPSMVLHATGDSPAAVRRRAWVEANRRLHDHILDRLRAEGPLLSRDFESQHEADWHSTGWTSGRNVSQMLDFLWLSGQIMVARRAGGQKQWDLAERCLPDWTPRAVLSDREVTRQAVLQALRSLGVARPRHIRQHFLRGRYTELASVLPDLLAEGAIVPVVIEDGVRAWPGPWYVPRAALEMLDRLESGDWRPRTVLLSPFDNLICDRARAETLFNFQYRVEIYTPAPRRQYGYYVMPILHGERLIGRLDPEHQRREGCLAIKGVYAEDGAPDSAEVGRAVAAAVVDLARFVGARAVVYRGPVPGAWRTSLVDGEV